FRVSVRSKELAGDDLPKRWCISPPAFPDQCYDGPIFFGIVIGFCLGSATIGSVKNKTTNSLGMINCVGCPNPSTRRDYKQGCILCPDCTEYGIEVELSSILSECACKAIREPDSTPVIANYGITLRQALPEMSEIRPFPLHFKVREKAQHANKHRTSSNCRIC